MTYGGPSDFRANCAEIRRIRMDPVGAGEDKMPAKILYESKQALACKSLKESSFLFKLKTSA